MEYIMQFSDKKNLSLYQLWFFIFQIQSMQLRKAKGIVRHNFEVGFVGAEWHIEML